MDYRIHHLDLVETPDQRFFFKTEIQAKIPAIASALNHYQADPVLHIFIKKDQANYYTIFASLYIDGNDFLIKETGAKAALLVNTALDKLLEEVKKLFEMNDH